MFFFLKRKTFTYFLLFVLLLAGVFSVTTIRKESFPEIEVPIVLVNTVFPGASALDVEELVTNVIEEQLLRTLTGVEGIDSTSREGFSSVFVEFNTSVDITQALQEVKDEVDIVLSDLPDDVGDPLIDEVSFSDEPVLIVSIASRSALTELSNVVDEIEDALLSVRGVSDVDVAGLPDREVTVVVEPEALRQFGLNATDVLFGIARADASLPIGEIIQDEIEYSLSFEGDLTSAQDVADTVIARTQSGEPIYVRDVALVEDGLAAFNSRSRLSIEGSEPQQAVTFFVRKQVGADVTEVTGNAKQVLAEIQERRAGEDLEFVTLIDLGDQVFSDLAILGSAGAQTVGLVFLLILIGLGFRESLLGAISVPLSFVLAFGGLLATGNTLNFVSLFALILVIGILVDGAVVITEGISNNLQKGQDPDTAARSTLTEFASSVIAGTATTVAVFIPLLFLSGITGQFIASIPRTVIIVLLASLFVALFLIPVIGTKLVRVRTGTSRGGRFRNGIVEHITKSYESVLMLLMEKRWLGRSIVGSIVLLLFVSFWLVGSGRIKGEFFPPDDFDQVAVSLELPPGFTLEQTSDEVVTVENTLRDLDRVESFVTTVEAGSADITVVFGDKKDGKEMVPILRSAFAGLTLADVRVTPPSNGPSEGAPFAVKFIGDDLEELSVLAQDAAKIVEAIPGTIDVETSVDANSTDIAFVVDREQVSKVGLDVATLAQIVRVSLFGSDATSFKHPVGGEDVDVVVKVALNPDYTSSHNTNIITVDTLRSLPIQTPSGEVLLGSLMTEDVIEGTPAITHEDGQRVVTVSSFIEDGLVVNDVNAAFLERAEGLEIPEGIRQSFGGDTEATAESGIEMLLALLAGVLLVIAVLVFQFNSIKKMLFVVSVIPFGLVGVLFGLYFFNQTLSFSAMLGFVALVGIVINNSIILIDVMSAIQDENGQRHREIVLAGASSRLRPILLTTATTVIGMVPLLTTSPFWMPLALAIISGLLFAVILTLFVVPLFYYWWGRSKSS